MALVVLGIFQYLLNQIKSNTKARTDAFDILEAEKLETIRLKGQIIIYEAKYTQMKNYAQKYYKLYKHYENLYTATIIKPPTLPELKPDLDKSDDKV